MNTITVIGSSNTDMVIKTEHLPKPGETVLGGSFLMNPGGKGANQAVAAARLGAEVSFVARIGNDLFGEGAIAGLRKDNICTDWIQVDPKRPSGIATITVDQKGENCIAVASGANEELSPADIKAATKTIERSDVLLMQLETPLKTIEYAARLGKEKKNIIILNPAPAAPLPDSLLAAIDLITPNETEAEMLTGQSVQTEEEAERAAQILHTKGIREVVITLGKRGAYFSNQTSSGLIPVPNLMPIDTTAAGDTFNGALAVALANEKNLRDATRFACKAAAISVTRLGAQASCPTLKEVNELTFP